MPKVPITPDPAPPQGIRAEERLLANEALLAQAEQLANIGSWELNIEKQTVTWSAHFYHMLGREPETGPIAFGRITEVLHPDDWERALLDGDQLKAHGLALDNELRFVTESGDIRIFHSRAIPVVDQSGRVVLIRGMSQDITDARNKEDHLRKREALLSQAEQMANFGSWEFDFKTGTAILSKQLREMYGLEAESDGEVDWSREAYYQKLHPMDRDRVRRAVERGLAECQPYEYVARYMTPDGNTRVHSVRAIPFPGPDGKAARSIGVVQDITDQKQAEDNLHRLSQELLRAQDEGNRHMARDLHESAGQSLAALKMTLGSLGETLSEKDSLARELLKSAIELAEGAVREVRTITYSMHPPMLDEAGLASALRCYAEGFSKRSGIKVKLDVQKDLGRQAQEIEMTMFRIVQEALINVHRYSGSRIAHICVARENGYLRAEVRDEGCGIAPVTSGGRWRAPPGVGIPGMRERVKQLNGVFELESAPGRGTTVRAILALDAVKSHASSGGNSGETQTQKKVHARRSQSVRQPEA